MASPDFNSGVLLIHIAGGGDEPERVLHVGAPSDGVVRVREVSSDDWSTGADEREVAVAEVLALCERATAARRRVNPELYRIRAWLDGTPL